jgi:Ca-activated chloride channel homolog
MLRRNRLSLSVLLLASLCYAVSGGAQSTPVYPTTPPQNNQNSASQPGAQAAPAQGSQPPAGTQTAPSDQPPAEAGQDAGQQPDSNDNGVFLFKKQVQNVILHATVVDDKQHMITNLDQAAFTIYENGVPQKIVSFRHEDIPVAMGIVIDNSGSMREKRAKVNQAALNLVRSSNPQDEVCIVNFNDEFYLDQPFTSNINLLKDALEKYETRGGTALYDAVVATSDELRRHAKLEKKVIFVVTDGEDNASRESLEQAIHHLQEENGPTVYAIGLLGEEKARKARRALEVMSEKTGGLAFLPKTLDEVDAISRTVAHDIRNQYTLGYKPSTPTSAGGYRQVKVDAKAKDHGKLTVRTKSGYYAGQQERASVNAPQ